MTIAITPTDLMIYTLATVATAVLLVLLGVWIGRMGARDGAGGLGVPRFPLPARRSPDANSSKKVLHPQPTRFRDEAWDKAAVGKDEWARRFPNVKGGLG